MKQFFKTRLLNSYLMGSSFFLVLISYILAMSFDQYKESLFFPVFGLFLPIFLATLILFVLPKKVFRVWFFCSIPIFLVLLIMTFNIEELSCSWGVCFSRGGIIFQFSAILFGNLIWIASIIAFIWHLIEKRKLKQK